MLAKLLLALIRIYQLTLSKLILAVLGPVCRFEPSCSRYAAACISGHGALRGSLLSVKRLCKCHPFHPGGYDPPPPPPNSRIDRTTAGSTTVEDSPDHESGHESGHESQHRNYSPTQAGVLPSG